MMNADGSNRMDDLITFPFVITASEYMFYPVPVWNPDSNAFMVIIPPEDPFADPGDPFELFMVGADGTTSSFGPFLGAASHFEVGEKIAPDGSEIAYFESTGSGFDLFIAEIGGTDTPYDSNVTSFKGWLTDMNHFMYLTTSGELWAGAVGETPVLIDGTGGSGDIIFLQDGQFVFSSGSSGAYSIRLGSLDSGNILIASPVADFPVFGPIFDAVP
jgi:hypothetical protein